ncbi:hypothetical protein EVAR_26492_1 [Eumeta japonica]|uniref:Uncharacterized protein n=1 Tax=Eumeta variegata TaxID=151549 RepID=A0A4C1V932_EUMVA|nr:hypothetical protein EVAR_26492_1 [Eumeta japonica]
MTPGQSARCADHFPDVTNQPILSSLQTFTCRVNVSQILETKLQPLSDIRLESNTVYLRIIGDNVIILYHGAGLMTETEGVGVEEYYLYENSLCNSCDKLSIAHESEVERTSEASAVIRLSG